MIDDEFEKVRGAQCSETGEVCEPEIGDLIWSCVSGLLGGFAFVHIEPPEFGVQFVSTFPG